MGRKGKSWNRNLESQACGWGRLDGEIAEHKSWEVSIAISKDKQKDETREETRLYN